MCSMKHISGPRYTTVILQAYKEVDIIEVEGDHMRDKRNERAREREMQG